MIPAFYINLDSAPARRAFMEEQFLRLGVTAIRVAACTPTSIDSSLLNHFCDTTKHPHVLPKELACTMSHRAVWQRMIDERLPWALILEDDVTLSGRLTGCLRLPSAKIPDLDVIRIETRELAVALDPADGFLGDDIRLHRPISHNSGSAAYLVSSKGARKLVAADYNVPADDVIYQADKPRKNGVTLRQAVPGLAMQANHSNDPALSQVAKSTIGPDGAQSRRVAEALSNKDRLKAAIFIERLWRLGIADLRVRRSKWRGGTFEVIPFAAD